MPELPEVECFRRMLLPLINPKESLHLELVKDNPSRKMISREHVEAINKASLCVQEIKRRGKQICLCLGRPNTPPCKFLFVHMGMTGRITTPHKSAQFGHFANNNTDGTVPAAELHEYPPPYTYLTFRAGDAHASFSDPRKFGSIYVADDDSELNELAPDALQEQFDVNALCGKPLGVKALLLDQKRVVSGVGNWVADEILYQTGIHPLQTHLTMAEALSIQSTLPKLLRTAVECLEQNTNYPAHWLFHFRWTKAKSAGAKDAMGRPLQFLNAGGRTSAIVPAVQKLIKSRGKQGTAAQFKEKMKPNKAETDNVPVKRKRVSQHSVKDTIRSRLELEIKD